MRLYLAQAKAAGGKVLKTRFAGSIVASRDLRRNLSESAGVPLKSVDVHEVDFPTGKVDLLDYLNKTLLPQFDKDILP